MSEEQQAQIEEKARAQGWVDVDEWEDQGKNPDDWRPAEDFVKKGEDINAILKERNDALVGEIRQLKNDFQSFRQHMQGQLTKREERAYQKAIADVKKKQEKAVEEGDMDAYRETEKEVGEIQREMQDATRQSAPPPEPNPEFETWVNENKWYQTDHELQSEADILGVALAQKGYTGQALFNEVTKRIKMQFPEKFNSQPKKQTVEGGTSLGGKKKTGKGKDLPDDAKAAADRFVKQGLFKDRDEYAKEYFAGEED